MRAILLDKRTSLVKHTNAAADDNKEEEVEEEGRARVSYPRKINRLYVIKVKHLSLKRRVLFGFRASNTQQCEERDCACSVISCFNVNHIHTHTTYI